jgi:hypothetical protein
VDQGDAADGEREREVRRGARVGYRFAERSGQAFLIRSTPKFGYLTCGAA